MGIEAALRGDLATAQTEIDRLTAEVEAWRSGKLVKPKNEYGNLQDGFFLGSKCFPTIEAAVVALLDEEE